MDEETKRLKLDGVGPRTPPQSDSEDDLAIEEIREKRIELEKERKKKAKDEKKKQMNDFYKSLGKFKIKKIFFKIIFSRIPSRLRRVLWWYARRWKEVE